MRPNPNERFDRPAASIAEMPTVANGSRNTPVGAARQNADLWP